MILYVIQSFLQKKIIESVEVEKVHLQELLLLDLDYEDFDNIHSANIEYKYVNQIYQIKITHYKL